MSRRHVCSEAEWKALRQAAIHRASGGDGEASCEECGDYEVEGLGLHHSADWRIGKQETLGDVRLLCDLCARLGYGRRSKAWWNGEVPTRRDGYSERQAAWVIDWTLVGRVRRESSVYLAAELFYEDDADWDDFEARMERGELADLRSWEFEDWSDPYLVDLSAEDRCLIDALNAEAWRDDPARRAGGTT